jgi:hypothetical protein
MAVRLSALLAGRPLPQEDSWYSFLLEAVSTPVPLVRLEGLGQLRNPMTSSGIEPAIFRLLALWLNQLRYRLRLYSESDLGNLNSWYFKDTFSILYDK